MSDTEPKSEYLPKSIEIWGGVTDPRHHKPRNFRYTVYGIDLMSKLGMTMQGIDFMQRGEASQEEAKKQGINLLRKPEAVAERVGVSMSLIDQDHIGTWGNSGLIIEVPVDNMIAASTTDLGSGGTSAEWLKRIGRLNSIQGADQILLGSGKDNYNEIVAWGTSEDGSPLKLAGFFSKTIDGEDVDPDNAKILREHAKRLGLPFVQIETFKKYMDERLEYHPENKLLSRRESLYMSYGGRRYIILSGGVYEFKVLNATDETHFMSPEEFEEMLINLRRINAEGEDKISSRIIEELREKYHEADAERRKPKLESSDGKVIGFAVTFGYGDEEKRLGVRTGGAWINNVPAEKRESRKSLANLGGPKLRIGNGEPFYRRPASITEVERILHQAPTTDEHTSQQISEFLDPLRDIINSGYDIIKGYYG